VQLPLPGANTSHVRGWKFRRNDRELDLENETMTAMWYSCSRLYRSAGAALLGCLNERFSPAPVPQVFCATSKPGFLMRAFITRLVEEQPKPKEKEEQQSALLGYGFKI
jgi:hypothetical protein